MNLIRIDLFMDHFVDVTLRGDAEFSVGQVLAAAYGRLHRALAANDHGRIGISFPEHHAGRRWLGPRLRIHGSWSDLSGLMDVRWLGGVSDYADVSQISGVPSTMQHRTVRRVQIDSSPERLRRRLMHRHQIDEVSARQRIPDGLVGRLDLPWLQVHSSSSGQRFRLFIEHGPLQQAPTRGKYSTYGLSATATIPWF